MTDLLSRPHTTSSRDATGARPLTVSAALAALAAAGAVMGGLMVLAVVGWFLADAGAHGQTTDALRVGADAWLTGHGSRVSLSGVPLGIVPLTLTGAIAFVLHRFGRWAAGSSAAPEDDRSLVLAATVLTGVYVVVVVIACLVVSRDSAAPGLGRAIVGSLLLSGVAGTLGLASGAGRLRSWADLVPRWIRSVVHGAAVTCLLFAAASAVLVVLALLWGIGEAATVMSGLQLGASDYVTYLVATVAVVPNAVLLGAAYLLGPGFALGTGTVVAPTVVSLGPVPAFPLLAAVPDSGPTPTWAVWLLAVPVLAAIVGASRAQSGYRVPVYDSAALRGFGSGFGAALLTTLAIALAGGPMGTGRMADIGAPLGEVLVAATMAMSLGGLVGGVATAWWQRRR